jgi:hypothetical protein
MNSDPAPRDRAKARFIVIQLARLTGVAMVLLGLLAMQGKLGLPPVAGYALAAIGLIDVFIVPILLARRWKSPPP